MGALRNLYTYVNQAAPCGILKTRERNEVVIRISFDAPVALSRMALISLEGRGGNAGNTFSLEGFRVDCCSARQPFGEKCDRFLEPLGK